MPFKPIANPMLEVRACKPPQHARLQMVRARESLRGEKTAVTNVTWEAMTRPMDRKSDLLPSNGFIFLETTYDGDLFACTTATLLSKKLRTDLHDCRQSRHSAAAGQHLPDGLQPGLTRNVSRHGLA